MSDWLILRTSGRHTLPLADSLAGDGYGAWTPRHIEHKRAPRRQARTEMQAPLMPTYVFALACHLEQLSRLANADRKACPDFSIFHYLDRIPLIADTELIAVREIEQDEARRANRKRKVKPLSRGDTVNITDGGFAGMSGVVEHSDGRYTMVLFGRMEVKISTFLLRSDRLAA